MVLAPALIRLVLYHSTQVLTGWVSHSGFHGGQYTSFLPLLRREGFFVRWSPETVFCLAVGMDAIVCWIVRAKEIPGVMAVVMLCCA